MKLWWWVCDINRFPPLWREWRSRGLASLGWPPEYLRSEPEARSKLDANLRTLNRITKGDRIVAYLKDHRIGGIGTFERILHVDDASYDPLVEDDHGRHARVKWDHVPDSGFYVMAPEGSVPRRLRSILQIKDSNLFASLERAVSNSDMWSPLADSHQLVPNECPELHLAILNYLGKLEQGLRPHAATAHEFAADGIGTIDILAEDGRRNLVVIEAKCYTADDATLGQLARYMGWVSLRLPTSGRAVRGIIVAGEFTPKIRFAASALPNVRLVSYRRTSDGRLNFAGVPTKREEAVGPTGRMRQ